MNEQILVRYGDLILKGKNKKYFINIANDRVKDKLGDLPVSFDFRHDRFYVLLNGVDPESVIERLKLVAGLYSFSLVSCTEVDYDQAAKLAIELVKARTKGVRTTFKVETKRADKGISETSTEISQIIARTTLRNVPNLIVDVHDPELTLNIEMRKDGCYLYMDQIKGLGGFPIPVSGKAVVLLSGGIDSPVAAFLTMKKGLEAELIHFESTPMTSIEAVQKAIDIAAVLARFAPDDTITLRIVPFAGLHRQIVANVPEAYLVTIMRRMMIRIAATIMKQADALCLVTGDSIGQVASQTVESMIATEEVTDALIMRPLLVMDKLDIIKVAREIGTLAISNRAFSDCCSIYVPKNPVIRPQAKIAAKYEKTFPYPDLIERAIANAITMPIKAGKAPDITTMGLTVQEAFR